MDALTEKRANRFRFLNALYDKTNGSTHGIISMWEVGEGLDLDHDSTSGVVDYLNGENLLEHRTLGGGISITHYGVVEVENALSEPDKATQYFPPVVNIMHIQSMVNSQIQQGTHGSHQSLDIRPADLAAIRTFVAEFRATIDRFEVSTDIVQEARSELATLDAQLASPRPKGKIVVEGLRSIRTILEGAAATAVASELLPKLLPLLTALRG